jgi:hypothetical protein
MDNDKVKVADYNEFETIREDLQSIIPPKLREDFAKFSDKWRKFEQDNEIEFKKTKKAVKRILERYSLILPEKLLSSLTIAVCIYTVLFEMRMALLYIYIYIYIYI